MIATLRKSFLLSLFATSGLACCPASLSASVAGTRPWLPLPAGVVLLCACAPTVDDQVTAPPRAETPVSRLGSLTLDERLLCRTGIVFLATSPRLGLPILDEVKPPTGEPDAGNSHVRFGGRGGKALPTPIPATRRVVTTLIAVKPRRPPYAKTSFTTFPKMSVNR